MSRTPKSAQKKANTLFNYFCKTPPVSVEKSSKSDSKDEQTLRTSSQKLRLEFCAGDLVWAKLEGHPWWPSLVYDHPKEGTIWRNEGSNQLLHVQFFGNPKSRGWVKEKFVKPYNGSDKKECQRGGSFFSTKASWRDAVGEADEALGFDSERRMKLATAEDSSDEDDVAEVESDHDVVCTENEDINKTDKENKTPPDGGRPSKRRRESTGKPERKKRRRIVESDDEQAGSDSMEDSYQPPLEDDSMSSGSLDAEAEEVLGSSAEEEEEKEDDEDEQTEVDVVSARKRKRNGAVKSAKKMKSTSPEGVVRGCGGHKEPLKGKKKKGTSDTPSTLQSTKTKLSAFSATSVSKDATLGSSSAPSSGDGRSFPHTSLKFLQPDNLKDASRKSVDDDDYNPRTLHVPDDFLSKQTPAMRQWWALKSRHFDTILFFKMGKFYELFHMDATIGVNELGLLFMKGDHAHCGFPEISYGRFSDMLVQKGYKVARVEQTETPEQVVERCKQSKTSTKFDKVVKREICSIQSKGTKKSSFIDGDCCTTDHNFLLAVSEKAVGSNSVYGVCFIDVTIGTFHVGQFTDDRHGSRMRTLISHHPPAQVLYEKGKLSEKTKLMFNGCLGNAVKEGLKPGLEFWDGAKTLKMLSESAYFVSDSSEEAGLQWPEMFKEMISREDSLGLTPSENFALGLSALGAVVWYLRHCLTDDELLSMRSFEMYVPVDEEPTADDVRSVPETLCLPSSNKRMILDGVTLVNLEVLVNSSTGTQEGTLLQKLNSCKTSFGKRLFKQWLCSPLCGVQSINDRLDAVEDLMSVPEVTSQVAALLSKLPDLERLLNKIHALGSSRRSKTHPDGRAVFFEEVVYNKRKVEDFVGCLEGFRTAGEIVKKFEGASHSFKSTLLKQCTTLKDVPPSVGMFPHVDGHLKFFDNAFDYRKARSGAVEPVEGVNKDYDAAVDDVKVAEGALSECLEKFKRLLGCKALTFVGSARNRYQAEVPESYSRSVPDAYELTSQRKGFKRYQSREMKGLFARLMDAEDRRDAAKRDTMRQIFEQFDVHRETWSAALQCLSVLDVLMSLAAYSSRSGWAMCRPEIVSQDEAFLEIRNGFHPCVERNVSGGDFIPNDTFIGPYQDGIQGERVLLVTGPNMGGKSTLMRQVGLISLLAQLGCYVPAEKCRMTPVDRIFTRLGASDHIMSGESTFFVELSETSCVLRHATPHSLVLLDELGRGTATYDGNAIATAVLQELADKIKCRTLFSTHYHSIVDKFSSNPVVALGHMACMVENEDDDDPCQETITFLFKLVPGNCPKSYGFNAAKLAGIPSGVIKEAHAEAKEFEESSKMIELFRRLWTLKQVDASDLPTLLR